MNISLRTNTIYLIGIGGIGMSALARYFRQQGKEVSGYDRVSTTLSRQLESEGINIHYTDDPAYVPCDVGLVIYTPAIPDDNRELRYCREINVPVRKRAEVLEMIAEDHRTIAIAGTHGKTTITSMLAHILTSQAVPVNAFIGGIMNNYNSNLIRSEKSDLLLAEADEYDRSFLRLKPYIALVSAIAPDHLDIYGTGSELESTFAEFLHQVVAGGKTILHEAVADQLGMSEDVLTYGTGDHAMVKAGHIAIDDHHFHFDLSSEKKKTRIRMLVPGKHNIENACGAAAVCLELGVPHDKIKAGLESYTGVRRRFEYVIRQDNRVYVDDYAHHPDEIRACIRTMRALYPGSRITGIFQPHLYSRTMDFAPAFAESLDELDELLLLDIYPAREKAIKGVSSQMILDMMKLPARAICTREELPGILSERKPEAVVSMGAGDIDQLVEPIKNTLLNIK